MGPLGVFSYKMFYFASILIVLVVFVLLAVQDGHGEVWATPCTGTYLVIPFGLRISARRAGSGNRGITIWYQSILLPRVGMALGIFGLWIRVVLEVRISLDAYFDISSFLHDSLDSRIVSVILFGETHERIIEIVFLLVF